MFYYQWPYVGDIAKDWDPCELPSNNKRTVTAPVYSWGKRQQAEKVEVKSKVVGERPDKLEKKRGDGFLKSQQKLQMAIIWEAFS